jgi:hypothetical protein
MAFVKSSGANVGEGNHCIAMHILRCDVEEHLTAVLLRALPFGGERRQRTTDVLARLNKQMTKHTTSVRPLILHQLSGSSMSWNNCDALEFRWRQKFDLGDNSDPWYNSYYHSHIGINWGITQLGI